MAVRDAFTAEEWARVVAAPMLAGIAVTAAEPGGIWGAVKESVAVAGALREGKAGAGPLVAEVAAAYETAEGREMARAALKSQARGKAPAAVVEAAVAELAAVAGLVAAEGARRRRRLPRLAEGDRRPGRRGRQPRAASSASAARRSSPPRPRPSTGSPPRSGEAGARRLPACPPGQSADLFP